MLALRPYSAACPQPAQSWTQGWTSLPGQALAAGMGLFTQNPCQTLCLPRGTFSWGSRGWLFGCTGFTHAKAKKVSRLGSAAQWPLLRLRAECIELDHFSSRTVCSSSQAYVPSLCELCTRLSQYLIIAKARHWKWDLHWALFSYLSPKAEAALVAKSWARDFGLLSISES